MYKVLLVEDDSALQAQLREGLEKWGYKAFACENFNNVHEEFLKFKPHLILMDINLPFYDGFYWCGKIREISKVPILFLSSRDTQMDIIMAVNTGGDDYIQKPFAMSVLVAKIQALLRRAYYYGVENAEIIEHNGIIINISESTVSFSDKKEELTRNELKMLVLLVKEKGRIVSRERMMQLLWDDDQFVNENTLTVNINRLRSKLSEIELGDIIITKKGQGYMLS